MVLPLPALAAEVVVKPGETLSEIAERYKVSVSSLMKANGISDPDLVQVGRSLMLPSGAVRSRAAGGSITVARGETLSEIAERHGLTTSRLMQLNGLSSADHIEVGQKLVVPSSGGTRPDSGYNPKASEHVVRPGESLTAIAKGYGVPLKQLIAINAISNPDHVKWGTRLKLKPSGRSSSAKPAAKPTTGPAANPAPTATRPSPRPAAASTAAKPAARPAPAAAAASATVAAAPRPAPTTTATAGPGKPDWRSYGPLQVDWANWQPMGGSMVAPTLNSKGESLYLAINCSARKLNVTSQAGQWKTWDDPRADFEQQLVTDLCKRQGS
jgi:LysM repeat protein